MRRLALAFLIWPLLMAQAQAQSLEACVDELRAIRVYADAVAASRSHQELSAARKLAELAKELDRLRAEVETLKRAPAGRGSQ